MANLNPGVTIPEGYELLPGLTKENAEIALRHATDRGFEEGAVLTSSVHDGFLIPLGEGDVATAQVEEIEFPTESNTHDEIDAFAKPYGLDAYDGIEAAGAKPTKAEKIAYLTAKVTEQAEANSAALENGEAAGGLEPQTSDAAASDENAGGDDSTTPKE